MPLTREQLEIEARNLPRDERARLAEALIASLDQNAEIARAWQEEIRRRVAELESGTVDTIAAEQVFAEVYERMS